MQRLPPNAGLIAVIVADKDSCHNTVFDSVLLCIEGYLGVQQRRSAVHWYWNLTHSVSARKGVTVVLPPSEAGLALWSGVAPFCCGSDHLAVAMCTCATSAAQFLRIGATHGVVGAVMVVGAGALLPSWLGGHGLIATVHEARALAGRLVRWGRVGRRVCARRLWVAWAVAADA